MKLTLLGTGTPTPSLKRASSGYLQPEVVSKLSGEITRIVQQPDTALRISGLGLEMSLMQSAQFAEYMSREEARWAEVVRRSGARLD